MDFMFDWDNDGDRYSFDDSDRFDEDSLCSYTSEPESVGNNWRGWKRQNGSQTSPLSLSQSNNNERKVTSLVEITAQAIACHIPFEVVESFPQPIPELLQLRIAFWSFPENEEDIRLYSCLANGNAEEFQKGEHLYKAKAVKDVLQIGFHLSATVIPPQSIAQTKGSFSVAIVFDRRRITSCTCTCSSNATWCAHVVSLCLYRIHQANSVCLRAPVSDSLSRLHRDQLQKFAQYLISELPQQILPTAQRLLDELLSSQETDINKERGAPDPTAGPSATEQTSWCLDEKTLHENVKKTLVKFCVPAPMVFSDINYLTASAPPAASEWQSLLRPLRGREPEGMWNLLSIVREMFRRSDSNAIPLLQILTEEVLECEQMLIWWFATKVTSSNNGGCHNRNNSGTANATQHAAASLCDEFVTLWRLAALNPKISPSQRDDLSAKYREWHTSTIDKVRKARGSNISGGNIKKNDIENFIGFKPAIEACQMDWEDYPITGVTYSAANGVRYHYNRSLDDSKKPSRVQPMAICSEDIISTDGSTGAQANCQFSQDNSFRGHRRMGHSGGTHMTERITDGAVSSGSEGFCEPDGGICLGCDSDSSSNNKDLNSRSNSLDEQDTNALTSYGDSFHNTYLEDSCMLSTDNVFENNAKDNSLEAHIAEYLGIDISGSPTDDLNQEYPAACKVEQSDTQPSSDEYQMYFFDPEADLSGMEKKKDKMDEPNYFAGIKSLENKQGILFARAEALHAHGYTREACELARQLAEEMLINPPDLLAESANLPLSKSKKKKALTSISLLTSSTLSKASFLCTVLLEEPDCHHLAFKTGMFGLELARPPASNKVLEVKLAHQETELLYLLKRILLRDEEFKVLTEKAEQLKEGTYQSRGDALLPLTLGSFIFESLCFPGLYNGPFGKSSLTSCTVRSEREKIGFDGAVAVLGMKANVSEAEHPLLCESTRRQRGELAIAMLLHYKDDVYKLSKIMDKLLDKQIHPQYKAPGLVNYLTSHKLSSSSGVASPSSHHAVTTTSANNSQQTGSASTSVRLSNQGGADMEGLFVPERRRVCNSITLEPTERHHIFPTHEPLSTETDSAPETRTVAATSYFDSASIPPVVSSGSVGAKPKLSYALRYNSGKDTDSSAVEEEDDLKALEARLRCASIKKKPSQGMASIDSSAPETTSSDNSPTLIRRNWGKHHGPGSDSGSSGDSDSLGSSSSGDKAAKAKIRDESPPSPMINCNRLAAPTTLLLDSRSSTPNMKAVRFKGKRLLPTEPNQPSEASAHFMFELAKTVLNKAGGNSSTALFTQPTGNTNPTGPHRNLHICAFQIGLYALGLNNCVSPNWLSRTYSSHVSWITGQAMEIGSAAINTLIDTWEGHLTPPEVASLADRASRGRDPNMVKASAELTLSCLPHAQALNPSEVHRALFQCKEQSIEMLEKALLAVESAAKGGGVFPEVLFHAARTWFDLYEEVTQNSQEQGTTTSANTQSQDQTTEETVPPVSVAVTSQSNSSRSSPSSAPAYRHTPPHSQAQVSSSSQLIHPQTGQIPQAVVLQYPVQQPNPHHPQMPHTFVQPYNYVPQIQPFSHHYQPTIPVHAHNIHPAYVTAYPYQNQTPYSNVQNIHGHGSTHIYSAHSRPIGPTVQVYQNPSCHVSQMQGIPTSSAVITGNSHQTEQVAVSTSSAANVTAQQNNSQTIQTQQSNHNQPHIHLLSAFRVGMLAMETLGRRVHDDRPQTKYAKSPPYGDDVKWLLGIVIKLGTHFLQQFCATAVTAVVSPFVLFDIVMEAAHILARNNPAQVHNHLRSNILSPLVQKCLQMFIQCTHQRIHHIQQAEYDDFVGTVCSARNAFYMTPGGVVQFNELLQSLRRSKSCRKELWTRIVNGLATGNV